MAKKVFLPNRSVLPKTMFGIMAKLWYQNPEKNRPATGQVANIGFPHRRKGGGNEAPLTVKNLDTAEMDFVRVCGLSPERAALPLRKGQRHLRLTRRGRRARLSGKWEAQNGNSGLLDAE